MLTKKGQNSWIEYARHDLVIVFEDGILVHRFLPLGRLGHNISTRSEKHRNIS
jgi:hypothetical protein